LSAAAKEALLGHQFLTGLPAAMWLKLLEHNVTPKLTEMVSFCKQLLAMRLVAGDAPSPPLCAATASVDSTPNIVTPCSAVQELMMAVEELQIQQKAVVAALSTKAILPEIAPLSLTVHPQDLLVNLLVFHKPPKDGDPQ